MRSGVVRLRRSGRSRFRVRVAGYICQPYVGRWRTRRRSTWGRSHSSRTVRSTARGSRRLFRNSPPLPLRWRRWPVAAGGISGVSVPVVEYGRCQDDSGWWPGEEGTSGEVRSEEAGGWRPGRSRRGARMVGTGARSISTHCGFGRRGGSSAGRGGGVRRQAFAGRRDVTPGGTELVGCRFHPTTPMVAATTVVCGKIWYQARLAVMAVGDWLARSEAAAPVSSVKAPKE